MTRVPLFGGGGQQNRSMADVEQEIKNVNMGRGAFTSDLGGQDFWLVRDQGYTPLALVMGNSVFSMGIVGGLATALRGLGRGELTEYTQLMYDARQLALSRMKNEADQLGADGIVGVDFQVISHGTDVMEVWAVGTAVKYTGYPEGEGKGSRAQVVIPVAGDVPGTTASYTAPQPAGGGGTGQQLGNPAARLGGILGGIVGQVTGGDMGNV